MDEIATAFLKTYQVWHHRRLLITHLRTPRPELIFIANALQADKKNYHTWAYRQWILAEFNEDELWDGELPFVEQMLSDDLRNNSAWNHRFFVVWESGVRAGEEDRETLVKREIAYAFSLRVMALGLHLDAQPSALQRLRLPELQIMLPRGITSGGARS
jgi:protein farnesyltransferase/geranylgeranyltransferase type-1 subunit alpha